MSDFPELIQRCLAERHAFRTQGIRHSPACTELFRRAFDQDEMAWEAIFTQVFREDIRRFVTAAMHVIHNQAGLTFSAEDMEDAQQLTKFAYWQYATKRPGLLQSGELGPLMQYLKLCAKSGVDSVVRKLRLRNELSFSDLVEDNAREDDTLERQSPTGHNLSTQRSFTDEVDNLRAIIDELRKLLQNDQERLVAEEIFLNDTPPRELVEDYPDRFAGDTKRSQAQSGQSMSPNHSAARQTSAGFSKTAKCAPKKGGRRIS
ncbi:MAG: hypothetical protein R3E79_14260 [Caldilineaceae bacterium]